MLIRDIIKAAYANLGVTDITEGPSPEQYAQGLQSLNSMLASWKEVTLYGLVDESFALTPGTGSYTVVSGGGFNTAWAMSIEKAFLRDSNNLDYPVRVITTGEYSDIPDKDLEGQPELLFYNPKGYPTGNVTMYPVPDKAYDLHWSALKVLGSFANIDTTLTLPPEYEEAIEFNLSIRLAPKCVVPPPASIVALAKEAYSKLPIVVNPAHFDGAFRTRNSYNVYSGQ